MVGAIPCGEPETEEENIVEYVILPVSLFGHGDFYILKADGDSMADAGIDNGDMVAIRKPIWGINWSLNLEETGASVFWQAWILF